MQSSKISKFWCYKNFITKLHERHDTFVFISIYFFPCHMSKVVKCHQISFLRRIHNEQYHIALKNLSQAFIFFATIISFFFLSFCFVQKSRKGREKWKMCGFFVILVNEGGKHGKQVVNSNFRKRANFSNVFIASFIFKSSFCTFFHVSLDSKIWKKFPPLKRIISQSCGELNSVAGMMQQ